MGLVVVFHVCVYAIFYRYMFEDIPLPRLIPVTFGNFMVNSVPADIPILINILLTISQVRLNRQGIEGSQAHKTTQSSRMDTLCFDKTGTLT